MEDDDACAFAHSWPSVSPLNTMQTDCISEKRGNNERT